MKPNILLLHADQHNAAALGCAGHPDVKTPNLDQMAANGMLFHRAYCQDGVCMPSRSSMLTGQYCRTLGMLHNSDGRQPQNSCFTTIPQHLQANGYFTGAFARRHVAKKLDGGYDRCFSLGRVDHFADEYWDEWLDAQGVKEQVVSEVKAASDARLWSRTADYDYRYSHEAYITRRITAFFDEAGQSRRPFFAWVSWLAPHQPYAPTRQFADLYDPAQLTLPGNFDEAAEHLPPLLLGWRHDDINIPRIPSSGEGDFRQFLANYYGLISQLDHSLGTILDALRERDLLDNTLIVYTADHGDFAAAHRMVEKACLGHNVYEDTLRVPFIVHWPDRIEGYRESDDLVELIDLFPTFVDAAGIIPPGQELPGQSLLAAVTNGDSVNRNFAFSENWSQTTVIGKRCKLGRWVETANPAWDFRAFGDMMFDRVDDPWEMNNIYGNPDHAHEQATLETALDRWLAATPDDERRRRYPESLCGGHEEFERTKLPCGRA